MKIDYTGRTVLVTGGTRGIGAGVVKLMEAAGARVIATGREDSVREARSRASSDTSYAVVDLSHRAETEAFARDLESERIDVLINNAGINRIALVGDVDMGDWDEIQEVNVRAPMVLCRALAPRMAAEGYGRIVNISSIFGHVTRSMRVSYTTSKYALLGLTKTVAVDYAKQSVLCNAVAPGFIDTELTRTILSSEQREELAAATPLGRLGTVEEIARVIGFLASEANSFITGQLILADGGFTSV